jgi:colanic acid/amylovoran biosynthesis glycosyltransferase
MKTVLVYREQILPISETFIQAQTKAITRFSVKFAGLYPEPHSLTLPGECQLLTSSHGRLSRMRQGIYKATGVAPLFHRKISAWNPSLVHAHFAPDGVGALPLLSRLQVPLIVTLHGYDITVNQHFKRVYSDLWKRADLFLCVSEFIKTKALDAGFPEDKLLVHYIGIDSEQFAPKESPRKRGHVLFVGRLVEKKGCTFLLSAMLQVQRVLPEAALTIIGDGPLRPVLETQAGAMGVSCNFLGSQGSEMIRQHMRFAEVFCAPSVSASNGDSEGFGMVFLEAQAMGVPVVSFQHGGVPEAIENGVTGLLAPERNVNILAEHILHYLQDHAFRTISGIRGVERVRERFNLFRQTAELEHIYNHLIRS